MEAEIERGNCVMEKLGKIEGFKFVVKILLFGRRRRSLEVLALVSSERAALQF